MLESRALTTRERAWLRSPGAFARFWPPGAPGPATAPWLGVVCRRDEARALFARAADAGTVLMPDEDAPSLNRTSEEESAGGCLVLIGGALAILGWGLWELASAIDDGEDGEGNEAGDTAGEKDEGGGNNDDGTNAGGDGGYWDPDNIGGGRKPIWM